jgi:glutaconyl-CoA/methylmalonyl-CoA decarboxylase subunit gamma
MSEYVLRMGGREYRAAVKELTPEHATIDVDGKEYRIDLVQLGRRPAAARETVRAAAPDGMAAPVPSPPAFAPGPARRSATREGGPASAAGEGVVAAPMPGMVLGLKVKEGEKVQAGQVLLVMEAMKMENAIAAPFGGTVSRVHVREGDSVGEGDRLVELDRPKLTAL